MLRRDKDVPVIHRRRRNKHLIIVLEQKQDLFNKRKNHHNHMEGLRKQITRMPYPFPTVNIRQLRENINDYTLEDFELHHYQHHGVIKFNMIA
jgi:thymidylate synthase